MLEVVLKLVIPQGAPVSKKLLNGFAESNTEQIPQAAVFSAGELDY